VTGIGPNSGDAIKVLMHAVCLYDGHGANAIQVKGRLAASTFHLTIYHSIIKDQGQYPYGVIVSTRIMRITHIQTVIYWKNEVKNQNTSARHCKHGQIVKGEEVNR